MKKFSKILILVLSLVIAMSAFAIASSANSPSFLVEGLYRDSWEDAIENAYIKGNRVVPVELLTDYDASAESVEVTESVVISLNGHSLKFDSTTPLFVVSGEDTTLTITGPGTIYTSGTLVEVKSGSVVFDSTSALNIVSEGSADVAVIGSETSANASVKGALAFESSNGAALFGLENGSEFNISEGNSISAKAGSETAAAIISACANSKINVNGGSLANSGGYIVKIEEGTDAESPVTINFDNATLTSDSVTYGSIVEAGAGYANVNVRNSVLIASGGAFTADNTLLNFEGEGANKIYAKPTLNVNFTVSTYEVSENANANASLFNGNITGIVSASELWISNTSAIAMNSRIWDGECGILLKKGTKLTYTTTILESEITAPLKDADGVDIYFNADSTTNKNFSLETIDGKPCELHKSSTIGENNDFVSHYIVTNEITSFIDGDFSSSFNDPNGKHPYANAITHSYGEITFPTVNDNRFFQWEFDAAKADLYSFAAGNSYIELDAGGSSGSVRGFDAIVNNDFITWDFDIANTNGTYSYAGLKMFIREKSGSYAYTDTSFGYITNNTFSVNGVAYALPTTPYTWTHITLVLEIDSSGAYSDGKVMCYPNLGKSMIHFYANGEYISSTKMFNSLVSSEDGIKKSSEFALDSIRLGMSSGGSVAKDKSTSLIIDNNILTYYPKGYEGKLSGADAESFRANAESYYNDKTAWESDEANKGVPFKKNLRDYVGDVIINLKDAYLFERAVNLKELVDVVCRKAYPVPGHGAQDVDDKPYAAIVDGVKYYNIEDALLAIVEGSVVELACDVDEVYRANASFTVYTKNENGANYKFNVVSDSYYLSEIRDGGEVIGYKTMLAGSFVTVYWKMDGGVYETKVPIGVTPYYDGPAPVAYSDELGRYFEFAGFTTVKNGNTPEEIEAIDKDDFIKGYKIYYPIFTPTKVWVSFVDNNGKELFADWCALGETPDYDKEVIPGYETNDGRYIATVGWSTVNGDTVPNAKPVTVNDILSGAKVFYPVTGVQKVEVDFLDQNGKILQTEWVNVGATAKELAKYNDGSSFGLFEDVDDPNFNYYFEKWSIAGGLSAIGETPTSVSPYFNIPVAKDIKYSYTIERFTQILPQIYVNIPGFKGFSLDGETLLSDAGISKVSINNTQYTRLNGGTTHENDKKYDVYLYPEMLGSIVGKNVLTLYVHFEYEGKTYIQDIECNFNDYLDNSIQKASENAEANAGTIKALMETVRLADTFAKFAGKETLPVCKKYLGNANYAAYLTDLSTVSTLITEATRNEIEANLNGENGLYSHFLKNIRWDFVNNDVYFSPITTVHVNITNGYNKVENQGDFFRAAANNRMDTTLYKTDSSFTYYSREGAKSITTLRGGIQGTFVARINNTGYGVKYLGAISNGKGADRFEVKLQDEFERKDMFVKFYSLSAHILELERRSGEGEEGLATELEMARVIYAAQYSYNAAAIENDGRNYDFSKVG